MTRAIVIATILLVLLAFFALTYELANKVNPDSSTSRVLRPVVEETTTSTTQAPTTTSTTQKPATKKRAVPVTTTPTTAVAAPTGARAWSWDYLADCESGEWDGNRVPIHGTARWDDNRAGYEGGVHFAPGTWDGFKPAGFPDAAYLATREQQIEVAERVLVAQGPGAWPVCSRKIGMRA